MSRYRLTTWKGGWPSTLGIIRCTKAVSTLLGYFGQSSRRRLSRKIFTSIYRLTSLLLFLPHNTCTRTYTQSRTHIRARSGKFVAVTDTGYSLHTKRLKVLSFEGRHKGQVNRITLRHQKDKTDRSLVRLSVGTWTINIQAY